MKIIHVQLALTQYSIWRDRVTSVRRVTRSLTWSRCHPCNRLRNVLSGGKPFLSSETDKVLNRCQAEMWEADRLSSISHKLEPAPPSGDLATAARLEFKHQLTTHTTRQKCKFNGDT